MTGEDHPADDTAETDIVPISEYFVATRNLVAGRAVQAGLTWVA